MRTVRRDRVGSVEQRGVDYIPEEERHSRPLNVFWVMVGCQFTFGVIINGWLPITFGLGWWSSVTAIIAGTAVGSLVLAPSAIVGMRAGTNTAVASGAYFGVVGRLLGTIIAMFIALGFGALTIWTGGQAAVAGAHRLFGTPDGDAAHAIAYGVVAIVTVVISVYGHSTVVAAQKFMVPTAGLLLLVGVFVFAPTADTGYAGGEYLLGSFWPTWILAFVTLAAIPISLVPFVNDYARYISPTRYSAKSVAWATGIGAFLGLGSVFLWAAYTATTFAEPAGPYIAGLVAASPAWYIVPIMFVGIVGGLGQSTLCFYCTGLDFSSLFPKLRRVAATLVLGVVAVAFVYLGSFVWEAIDTISAFLLILMVWTTPFAIIMLIGHFRRRGFYRVHDLQVFTEGRRGGAYWFTAGVNARAFAAFIPAVIVGTLCINTTIYTGPWANVADGVDLSFVSSAAISFLLYLAMLRLFPEPRDVSQDDSAVEAVVDTARPRTSLSA